MKHKNKSKKRSNAQHRAVTQNSTKLLNEAAEAEQELVLSIEGIDEAADAAEEAGKTLTLEVEGAEEAAEAARETVEEAQALPEIGEALKEQAEEAAADTRETVEEAAEALPELPEKAEELKEQAEASVLAVPAFEAAADLLPETEEVSDLDKPFAMPSDLDKPFATPSDLEDDDDLPSLDELFKIPSGFEEKEKARPAIEAVKEAVPALEEKAEEAADDIEEALPALEEKAEETAEAVEEALPDPEEKAEEAAEAVGEALPELEEKAEAAVEEDVPEELEDTKIFRGLSRNAEAAEESAEAAEPKAAEEPEAAEAPQELEDDEDAGEPEAAEEPEDPEAAAEADEAHTLSPAPELEPAKPRQAKPAEGMAKRETLTSVTYESVAKAMEESKEPDAGKNRRSVRSAIDDETLLAELYALMGESPKKQEQPQPIQSVRQELKQANEQQARRSEPAVQTRASETVERPGLENEALPEPAGYEDAEEVEETGGVSGWVKGLFLLIISLLLTGMTIYAVAADLFGKISG